MIHRNRFLSQRAAARRDQPFLLDRWITFLQTTIVSRDSVDRRLAPTSRQLHPFDSNRSRIHRDNVRSNNAWDSLPEGCGEGKNRFINRLNGEAESLLAKLHGTCKGNGLGYRGDDEEVFW